MLPAVDNVMVETAGEVVQATQKKGEGDVLKYARVMCVQSMLTSVDKYTAMVRPNSRWAIDFGRAACNIISKVRRN